MVLSLLRINDVSSGEPFPMFTNSRVFCSHDHGNSLLNIATKIGKPIFPFLDKQRISEERTESFFIPPCFYWMLTWREIDF
ncbi:hypothetical protein POVCU2_0044080 [Plasmodium ovale curtisi]|uniref:Uncharacterized protein n=1 Tax=Plasmodium ovale curtisi TaxID=864141 RepID=A0A1A8W4K8_PLAOA|nr:hypothetical protein POVCU2_0044080 [Plasmodium ovale curtisi]SBS97759.1 hypothetical protein POVCU1_040740 [Plasmodium ovale curtisi]